MITLFCLTWKILELEVKKRGVLHDNGNCYLLHKKRHFLTIGLGAK